MHSFPAGATARQQPHFTVRGFVEVHAQALQPLDDERGIKSQHLHQLRLVGKMPSADDVQVVVVGRILGGVGRLNPALRHDGVGVSVAELRGDDDLHPVFLGKEGGRGPRATAANDQDIRFIVGFREVHDLGIDSALGLEEIHHLVRVGVAVPLVGPDLELPAPLFLVVGMIGLQAPL